METETLQSQPSAMSDPLLGRPPIGQPQAGQPPAGRPPTGMRPTADPSRSGAMWVGGAGVALLLAAAGVLTAVRWDDIGQSVKLGGLVAITLALLAAGQRFQKSIPMTAQAIFHLGALLIPFDMAAVAILAGRTWQETLLLTSFTSVVAWYGIERAVPSTVLRWTGRGAVVGLAAGIAAMTPVAMPVALAVAAAAALAARKPTAAIIWAGIAAVLPIAAFVDWPQRIAGSMLDLGFDELDRWQPLAAGAIATLVMIASTRLLPRIEIAWAAVLAAVVTATVALGGFADAEGSYLTLAAIILGLELLALGATKDPLWTPIIRIVALAGELIAGVLTTVMLTYGFLAAIGEPLVDGTGYGMSAVLLGLAWLIADRRRLEEDVDWVTGMVVGSDWPLTTVMFPAAVLAAVTLFSAPWAVISLTAIGLAYWMVATWRAESAYCAILLIAVASAAGMSTAPWTEFALALLGAAVLMLAAQLRGRAKDLAASSFAAIAGSVALVVGTSAAVQDSERGWPIVGVLIAAWAMSWIVEGRTPPQTAWVADWMGRLTAALLLVSALWVDPYVGIAMCAATIALATIDYLRVRHTGVDVGHPLLTGYAVAAGAALGLAGVPITAAFGLVAPAAGAVLTIAGFAVIGIALASPRILELPLGVTAAVVSGLGLFLTYGDSAMFAVALLAVGSSALFIAAALRDSLIGVAGYVTVALGVALQLALWGVDWLEPYLVMPALAALYVGYCFHRRGGNSWSAYAPTIALMSYISIADRLGGGSAWHAVIAGSIGVLAIIGGGYRKLAGPLVTGSIVLAIVVGYESLGPASLVPTWAWLAAGGTVLLAAGVVMERSDTSPLERGQQIRNVIATQFT